MTALKLISSVKKNLSTTFKLLFNRSATPVYRLVEVEKIDDDEYMATIQLINRNQILKMKPEDILSDDRLTDAFSPRDIRALTYLGYLSINSPKYRILANRFSENDKRMLFTLKEKGNKVPVIKFADEIASNPSIIKNLTQNDSHIVGFAAGTESVQKERDEIKKQIELNAGKKSNSV